MSTGEPATGTEYVLRKGTLSLTDDPEAETWFLVLDENPAMVRVTQFRFVRGMQQMVEQVDMPAEHARRLWRARTTDGYVKAGRHSWCACCCN